MLRGTQTTTLGWITVLGLALGAAAPTRAQPFDPAAVGDLALWLDAADADTITIDPAGVLTWADKGPDGNDVAAGDAFRSPTPESFEGLPVLSFDGQNDVLCGATPIADSAGLTIFAVARQEVRKNYNGIFSLRSVTDGVPDPQNAVLELYWQVGGSDLGSGNLVWVTNRGNGQTTVVNGNTPPPLGELYVAVLARDGAEAVARTNGVDRVGPGTTPPNLAASAEEPCVGLGFGVGTAGNILDGDLAELLVYRSLSPGERARVEGYLLAKWRALQPKRSIPFTGRLTGTSSSVTVEVEIFDAPTGGNLVWGPEQHPVTLDAADPTLSIAIGSVAPAIDLVDESGATGPDGVPDLDQIDGDALYLEVTVIDGPQSETLAPRRRVLPHGFASRARIAERAIGTDPAGLDATHFGANSLSSLDFGDAAGVEYVQDGGSYALGAGDTTVASLTLDAPTAGYALVRASADFDSASGGQARCAITLDGTVAGEPSARFGSDGFDPQFSPVALTRGVAVPQGAQPISVVCTLVGGANGTLANANLTAVFLPTRYEP